MEENEWGEKKEVAQFGFASSVEGGQRSPTNNLGFWGKDSLAGGGGSAIKLMA